MEGESSQLAEGRQTIWSTRDSDKPLSIETQVGVTLTRSGPV